MTREEGSPDRDLVRRAQAGDRSAFDELVLRHQDRVFNGVFRFCGNHEDACDITQRAFLNAFRKIADFSGESAFSTWMYRIAFNQSVSFHRENRRPAALSIHSTDEETGLDPGILAAPEQRMESDDSHRKLQEALAGLRDDDRKIIVLKDIEERSYDEIAVILDIPKGTVRSRLHRARSELKERLKALMATVK